MLKKVVSIIICFVLIAGCGVTSFSAQTIPASYDLRNENAVTSVKNQTPFGTCWAFGGIASAETALIRQGLADKSIDLSEEALLWNACGDIFEEGSGWTNRSKNDGGFSAMVQGVLASKGAYLESDVPYNTNPETEYYTPEDRPTVLDTKNPSYRATDIVYVDTTDSNEIKQSIMDYGAISTSWHYDIDNINDKSAYWVKGITETNHQIVVVGWNDNYPKENFNAINGSKPNNNGAWIVKNSYGSDIDDNGFMWISYEDTSIFHEDKEYIDNYAYIFKSFEEVNKSEKVFQYDEYGAVSSIKDKGSMWANVYDFSKGKNYLNEITFESKDAKGQTCKIYYAPVYKNNRPVTNKSSMKLLAEKQVEYNGYTTVKFDNSVILPKRNGAIVIEFSNGASIGTSEVLLYAGKGKFIPNDTKKGTSWQIKNNKAYDLVSSEHSSNIEHESCNVTLKAVTSDNLLGTPIDISNTPEPIEIKVSSLKLNKSVINLPKKGSTYTLKATIFPNNAYNKSVTWKSNNKKVATVDKNGKIKATTNKGITYVNAIAKDGSKKSAKALVIVGEKVKGITLNKTSVTINRGIKNKTYQLKKVIKNKNATYKGVNWYSSNKNIATVNSNGKVTIKSRGIVTITVKSKDGSNKSAKCKITVKQLVTKLSYNGKKQAKAVYKNKTITFNVIVTPNNANNKGLTYSSSNKKIATVNSKGIIKGIKAGTVTITAKTKDSSKKL